MCRYRQQVVICVLLTLLCAPLSCVLSAGSRPSTGSLGIMGSSKTNRRKSWDRRNYSPEFKAQMALSRNISILLEQLLRNYENDQRPYQGVRPTRIETSMLIRSMGPVSELDMEYSMDCYFRQAWNDNRLRFSGPISPISLHIKTLERIWKPDTYFHNGRGSYLHTITQPNKLLRLSMDGAVLYSMRLTIKAKCPMELQSFPMDRQSCPLIFGSYAYTKEEMLYTWKTNAADPSYRAVGLVEGLQLSQFDLINNPYVSETVVIRNGTYSVLRVNFNLHRHMGYFLIQVYVPCGLLVILSWVSFWINREATADRVGLGMTTVLTLSTFGLDTRTDLPKVPYPTALDWFVIMCFTYVICSLLEFAGVHYFTKVGSGEYFPGVHTYDERDHMIKTIQELEDELEDEEYEDEEDDTPPLDEFANSDYFPQGSFVLSKLNSGCQDCDMIRAQSVLDSTI
ncbi:gamma-aminobutyric acid receptor alpha-like isoform X1 [Varroa destructor]|uniref:Gamma-aminobutyric acid receptor alpha-like n=2 Tax=Dermanyssoidea TaxID=41438 RepID=A0A7M7KC81_VARDE|nr:gamma-aminobutyric acid receptor alpha-like isoform X1 [Varroa destructor]XP_022664709.1 gamma-aminobutyric acid receptor alpha-like isoform X1 [Varroa destructor]